MATMAGDVTGRTVESGVLNDNRAVELQDMRNTSGGICLCGSPSPASYGGIGTSTRAKSTRQRGGLGQCLDCSQGIPRNDNAEIEGTPQGIP
jgi:hypothetical protein